jgi:hypothetical protein
MSLAGEAHPMTRLAKLLVLTCCAALALASVPAGAATPATATLSKAKRTLSWTGADTALSMPLTGDLALDCNVFGDPSCDHFALKIDLGEGAKVQVQIKGENPSRESEGTMYNDFDIFIYDPNGLKVASGESGNGYETVTFTHRARFRKKTYDVAVRPWLVVPGDGYKGYVKAVTIGK